MKTYDEAAETFCQAISLLASKEDNLLNLESYLRYCFASWMETYANTPEKLAAELKNFAEMEV